MFSIVIRTEFIAFHRWKDAPEEHKYLRDLHRHTFGVVAKKPIVHGDRDIEFIDLKNRVNEFLVLTSKQKKTEFYSCEHWAEQIANEFEFSEVEVNEDGENGAIYTRGAK